MFQKFDPISRPRTITFYVGGGLSKLYKVQSRSLIRSDNLRPVIQCNKKCSSGHSSPYIKLTPAFWGKKYADQKKKVIKNKIRL